MRQFLSTLDYKNGRMLLRPRTEENARRIRETADGKIAAEIPFALDQTHFLLALGGINHRDGLNFFVDSGLALEGCGFTVPVQTLNLLGIPEPERTFVHDAGGGGGAWKSAFITANSVRLGPLEQKNMRGGEYGALVPEFHAANGYFIDGIISHGFLRKYASWTIDFDGMRFIIEH